MPVRYQAALRPEIIEHYTKAPSSALAANPR